MERLLTLGLVNAGSATVLAILVAGLSRLFSRRPAAVHCLWLLVLLKLVMPPILEVPVLDRLGLITAREHESVSLQNPVDLADTEMSDIQVTTLPPLVSEALLYALLENYHDRISVPISTRPSWWTALIPWLAGAWLAGSVATLLLAAVRIHRFRRLLRQAYPAPHTVQQQVAALAEQIGLKRPPVALWIDATVMPMLWAVACRPRLIIPRQLWKGLEQRQQLLVLAHELAHLRRRDHVIRLFELFVTALYCWHPVVWWGRSALRDAEEQCCDAWVVWAFPDEARTYAETLLDTVDFLNPSRTNEPLLASGFGRAHHLRRRLTMIMLGTTSRRLGWASALGTLGLSAVLLPITPSWAQKAQESVETTAFVDQIKDDQAPKSADITKSEEVDVVVSTNDQVEKVQADSLDKAVELIKQRIQAVVKENSGPDNQAAQLKALKQAVFELEKARAGNPQHGMLSLRVDSQEVSPKLTAEKKAQIDKARSHIESLRKELKDKQQQLTSAQKDLEKLVGSGVRWEYRVTTQPVYRRAEKQQVEVHARVLPSSGGGRIIVEKHPEILAQPKSATSLTPSDQERLESLEKKLARLLDEVASLKKHEEKPK